MMQFAEIIVLNGIILVWAIGIHWAESSTVISSTVTASVVSASSTGNSSPAEPVVRLFGEAEHRRPTLESPVLSHKPRPTSRKLPPFYSFRTRLQPSKNFHSIYGANCSHLSSSCRDCIRHSHGNCLYLSCEHQHICIDRKSSFAELFQSGSKGATASDFNSRCHLLDKCAAVKHTTYTSAQQHYGPQQLLGSDSQNRLHQSLLKTFEMISSSSSTGGQRNSKHSNLQLQQQHTYHHLGSGNRKKNHLSAPMAQPFRLPPTGHGPRYTLAYHISVGTVLALIVCSSLVLSAVIMVAYKKIMKIYTTRNTYGTLREES